MPVLAVQPAGKGRMAVFTSDTTRNWQQVPRALDQESPFLRFWGQMVRWLANRTEEVKAEAGITARTDKAYYEPDSPITVTAAVRDKEGEGTDQAEVVAQVKTPQGTTDAVTLAPVAGSAGSYQGTFEPKRPGTYEIVRRGQARRDGPEGREDARSRSAGPTSSSTGSTSTMPCSSRIAAATGGRYFHISTADQLIGELDRKEKRRHVSLEQPLYFPRLFWCLFVGVLTTEWVLRRRFQLR